MSFRGIDIRQSQSSLLFDAFLQDTNGNIIATGTTALFIYQASSSGTLSSYDFSNNTFITTALVTASGAMTHQTANNNTFNTGIWTYMLNTVTGFTSGSIYYTQVYNSLASPSTQTRKFQYGGQDGDFASITKDALTSQGYTPTRANNIDTITTSTSGLVSEGDGIVLPTNSFNLQIGPVRSKPNALGQSNSVSGAVVDLFYANTNPSTVAVGSGLYTATTDSTGFVYIVFTNGSDKQKWVTRYTYPGYTYDGVTLAYSTTQNLF